MMEFKAIKYYSQGTHSDPVHAQEHVDELKKKHPDREFTILMNKRSQVLKFTVAQVKEVALDWPEAEDLGMPPQPEQPHINTPWSDPIWDTYREATRTWHRVYREKTAWLRDELRKGVNQ